MANAFFSGASGSGTWDLAVETAYNRAASFALRDAPVWMQTVDTKPANQAMPGDSVVFTIHQDLAAFATTPLSETVDPDAVAPQTPQRVTVTLTEYGNATLSTNVLDTLSFLPVEAERAVIVGRNMLDTMDTLIHNVADTSTNLIGLNGGNVNGTNPTLVGVTATDNFTRKIAAAVPQFLRSDKILPPSGREGVLQPSEGENYLCIAHPKSLYDLMAENSASAWIGPRTYGGDTSSVYNGSVGSFMGAEYISTSRVTKGTGDGAGGTVNVYRSYFLGSQAIAEAVAVDPHIVVGPVVDKLNRFRPLGWYFLGGFSLYRPLALRKCYTSSTLG